MRYFATALACTGVALAGCAPTTVSTTPPGQVVTAAAVTSGIAGWPKASRDAAQHMIGKYGPPNETTPTMLVWYATGPWKRTIISREEVPHSFPKQHTDVMEQFVDYRVPPDKFDELAAYDGSVIVERTKGELSARCDKEEMNFLAVNLANDVVTGRRTAEQARDEYARQAMAFMNNQPASYTTGLQFSVSRGGTADPDRPVM
ncbi:MAG TPA: hypothetical protein VFS56_11610 [Gemmatimonadaceae bacterium]|nr:hypothetical protein [Gemmatimonadaceae bacterium]